jgi:1-acyl-sn-glycerol-3-phosphate acyltransferase
MKKLIARFIFWISGWTLNRKVPKEVQRSVMIAAPHTSNWDAWLLIWAFALLDIPMKFTIKEEWTKHWLFGGFIRANGGIGIDRSPKSINKSRDSYVDFMAEQFNNYDKIAMVVTPEGTRRKQERWKMGFYHTAAKAEVPITFGYLDYGKKEAGVGGCIYLTDDLESDMRKIMSFYSGITPRHPENFSLDLRYYP